MWKTDLPLAQAAGAEGKGVPVDLRDLLGVATRSWWVVLLTTVATVAAGALYLTLAPTTYTASSQLEVVVTPNTDSLTDAAVAVSVARAEVSTAVEVLTTSSVLDEVIDNLHLPYTSDVLAKNVAAASPANSAVIRLRVTASDADLAADIADEIGDVLAARHGPPVELVVVEPPRALPRPTSPNAIQTFAVAGLLGFAIGAAAVIGYSLTARRVHLFADIRERTDLPVLGCVSAPRRRGFTRGRTDQAARLVEVLEHALRARGADHAVLASPGDDGGTRRVLDLLASGDLDSDKTPAQRTPAPDDLGVGRDVNSPGGATLAGGPRLVAGRPINRMGADLLVANRDRLVLVVSLRETLKADLSHALALLEAANARPIGIIVCTGSRASTANTDTPRPTNP